jgi:benzoate-CoA ligase family protein
MERFSRTYHSAEVGPYNAAVDLLGRNLLPGRSEAVYLRTSVRDWSYQEVAAAADGAGAGFLDLGLERGDRVLLALRDRPEFVAAFWGAVKAGLVPVPVVHGLTEADIGHLLGDSGARLVVCDEGSAGAWQPAAEAVSVPCVVVADPVGAALSWADVCGRPASLEAAPTGEEDVALWLYTSGTTGRPKGVVHHHRDLRRAPDGLARQVLGLEAGDVVLSVSKMFFGYGLGNSVYLPAAYGASVVVNEAPAVPARIQALLSRFEPTILLGVPAFFGGMVRLADAAVPSRLRAVITAGEALPAGLLEAFRSRFGLPLLDGIGSSEALHHVTSNGPDDVTPGSCGPALEGWEVEARDREGDPLPEGEQGELWWRGPTTFAGYWNHPELTAQVLNEDGWMRTGDLVRIRDGRVFHEGRLDDLVKMGGVWVRPTEIEDVLRSHPEVDEAAVVAADQASGVPVIRAFVVSDRARGDLVPELTRLCRERLAAFKVPASFEVVDELPRTATGKLRRFVLRSGG